MRYYFILFILFTCALSAQEPIPNKTSEKGVTPLTPLSVDRTPLTLPAGRSQAGETFAVVVGISDYQDEGIPDLRFADKDAKAFSKYLQSPSGGNVPTENIRLLTNEKATMAAVASELDWLVETSEEGDKAIIYFSGHGDVEAKTARQPGFLLTYDSPPKIYIAGAYPLFYLQLIIETLSSDKNVQTLIITDACRAGKLAGSGIGGTQATAANLAKQYANEIKILSCQPDEFSLEGEQWGGGRGAFSYHLIEGLIGLADKNENGNVNLLELENYLETVVPEETNPQSQIPMTVGSKGTKVAFVDAGVLAKLKDLKAKQLPTLNAIESKGFEEITLAGVDSTIQRKYHSFIAALEDDNLLDADQEKTSADDLYRELIEEESLASLHRFMTRQFATALQDDAQQAINAYLLANPAELEKRWKGDTTYAQYPRYLGRAAELLGESHYMHDYLIAKQLYFEGLNLRMSGNTSSNRDSLFQIAIEKQKTAIALEDRAAYFYNELGVLHTQLKLDEKAFEFYDKAIELAPEWALPYANYAVGLYYIGDVEKAIEYGERAGALSGDFPQIYSFIAWVNADNWSLEDKRNWTRSGTELQDNYDFELNHTDNTAQIRKRLKRSIALLQKAVILDSTYTNAFYNLGFLFQQVGKNKEAIVHFKKVTELDPLNAQAFGWIAANYRDLRKYKESEKYYEIAIGLDSTASNLYHNLGLVYGSLGKPDKAVQMLKKAFALSPKSNTYRNIGTQYLRKNLLQKSESYFLKAILFSYYFYGNNVPYTYIQAGNIYRRNLKRYAVAADLYEMALELRPDYVSAIKNLAKTRIKLGEPEKVRPLVERLDKLAEDNLYLYFDLAEIYLEMGQKEKAIEILQNQVAENADDDEILRKAAWNYQYWYGAYEEAESLFKRSLALKGDTTICYAGLGYTYLRDGKPEKSLKYFKRMYKRDSTNALRVYDIAAYYAVLGKKDLAIDWLEKALKCGNPGLYNMQWDKDFLKIKETPEYQALVKKYFPEVFTGGGQFNRIEKEAYYIENCILLGRIYEEKQMWDKATAIYQKALELKRDSLTDFQKLALAEAYLKLGQPEKAQSICPEKIESDDLQDFYAAGKVYYHLQKPERAKAHFEKFLEFENFRLARQLVGGFYMMQGELEIGLSHFDINVQQQPNVLIHHLHHGMTYFYHQDYERAGQAFLKTKQKYPTYLYAHFFCAINAYYQTPQTSKALFEQTATLLPDFMEVWDALELMRNNDFESADTAWHGLQSKFSPFLLHFVKYKYLQMKVREGKMQKAISLAKELYEGGMGVSYPVYSKDPELDPLRDLPEFQAYMHWCFPGKDWGR